MRRFLAVILIACCFSVLLGCDKKIKEYKGTPLINLTYTSVDHMGRFVDIYVVDFENNVVKKSSNILYDDEETEFEIVANFTDEQETVLINKIYTYGLFDIKDNYPSPPGIMDGGGWSLSVNYSDGTAKESSGYNNAPQKVFSDCAKAFYDVCREGIVAGVPEEYYLPPCLSFAFNCGNSSYGYSSYGEMLDYRWNGFESSGNSIYEVNAETAFKHKFYEGDVYTLVLYTANINTFNQYKRFKKCIVTKYDFNEEMTNETVVHSGRWFSQIELALELNKVYVIRLEFRNGDFVEYTFNTKITTMGA